MWAELRLGFWTRLGPNPNLTHNPNILAYRSNPIWPQVLLRFQICGRIRRSSPESRIIDQDWSHGLSISRLQMRPSRPKTPRHHQILIVGVQPWCSIDPYAECLAKMKSEKIHFAFWCPFLTLNVLQNSRKEYWEHQK